jgi:hypothetical protein
MDNDTPMVMVPKVAATVVHYARFPRGSLRLTSLSYQQFDPRRQTGGPRAYLSLAMWVAQGMTAPSTAHDAFPTIARVGKGERISLADLHSQPSLPLDGLQSGEFIFFTSYAMAGLILSFSSFTLLETYDLQLHHLSPHSIMLVAIFIHHHPLFTRIKKIST